MAAYLRPADLNEALAILAAPQPPMILAGGTDYYPARVGKPLDDDLLDITAIPDLRGIQDNADHWRIGATVTWSELAAGDLPPFFDGLRQAAREVGGAQVQNAGTLAGNLCNASPAADGAPMLMAMNARLELLSKAGRRELPLTQFISGNRRTQLQPGELVAAILLPKPAHAARSVCRISNKPWWARKFRRPWRSACGRSISPRWPRSTISVPTPLIGAMRP